MSGLPAWMLAVLAGLTTLLLVIGWQDRHEAGYIPFAIGLIFGLFTLAALGAKVRGEEE